MNFIHNIILVVYIIRYKIDNFIWKIEKLFDWLIFAWTILKEFIIILNNLKIKKQKNPC